MECFYVSPESKQVVRQLSKTARTFPGVAVPRLSSEGLAAAAAAARRTGLKGPDPSCPETCKLSKSELI